MTASVAVHAAYYGFLLLAYRHGDLSQAYPVARGAGPVVVVGFAGLVAAETPTVCETIGVLLISAGIMGIAFNRATLAAAGWRPIAFALVTGVMIGCYTLIDGLGVRAAGEHPLGYIAWFHIFDAMPILIVTAVTRRGTILSFVQTQAARSVAGGVMATLAYAMVMWAMSLTRLAQVAALREVSVILAAVLGTVFLGEPFGRRRVACALAVAVGILVLQF